MSVHVTHHAVDRYIERVADVSRADAYAAIACADTAIERASAFGASVVRLPSGAGLVFHGVERIRVVTVLGRGDIDGGHFAKLQQPVCCGACGMRSNHPIARACTRTDCGRGSAQLVANDHHQRRKT